MVRKTDSESSLLLAIRNVVTYELDSRNKPFKNGETWQAYLFRTITIERILLAGLLLFNLGGSVKEARQALTIATTSVTSATVAAEAASAAASVAGRKADAAAENIKAVQAQLESALVEMKQQAATTNELRDQVKTKLTRSEFNNALEQRILPRLDRIEKQKP